MASYSQLLDDTIHTPQKSVLTPQAPRAPQKKRVLTPRAPQKKTIWRFILLILLLEVTGCLFYTGKRTNAFFMLGVSSFFFFITKEKKNPVKRKLF